LKLCLANTSRDYTRPLVGQGSGSHLNGLQEVVQTQQLLRCAILAPLALPNHPMETPGPAARAERGALLASNKEGLLLAAADPSAPAFL
jgi:hypothetical protein